MRKIKFILDIKNNPDSVIELDKLYSFRLPNNSNPVFKNRKVAEDFIFDSEKMFTKILYDINEIYSALYQDFRMILFNVDLIQEKAFENRFETVRFAIHNSFERCNISKNGIYYAYKNVLESIKNLENIIELLDIQFRKMRFHQRIINNELVKERIANSSRKLKLWGWDYHNPHTRFKEMNISKFENDFFKSYPIC